MNSLRDNRLYADHSAGSSPTGDDVLSPVDVESVGATSGLQQAVASDGVADAQTVGPVDTSSSANSSGLTFTNSFGLDGTFSTLTTGEQAALKTDLLSAEADYSSLFTNSVDITIDLEAVDVPLVDGEGFIASNEDSAYRIVTLSQYFSALQSVDTSSYQKNSLAAVEKLNLTASNSIDLPIAYADMLGLGSAGQAGTNTNVTFNGSTYYTLSTSVDDTVFLNLAVIEQALDAQAPGTANPSVVGAIEHEMSEEAMGRVSDLRSDGSNIWAPMDFYRVNSAGQSDMTPNDGDAIFFSSEPNVSGPESDLQFNNSSSGGDYADWTSTTTSDPGGTDPFGGGDFNGAVGTESSTLSPTDIDIMNVLGWNLASSGGSTPPLSIALADDTGASSTDHLTNSATLTGSAAANATITFSQSGLSLGSATADAGGSWSFTPSLADGEHTVTASESYGSGQTVTASLTFTLATQAPTVSATESVSGQTSQTSDTIEVTAAAEDVAGNAIAGVEIFDGNAELGAATYSNGVWVYTADNLLAGQHAFTAEAVDTAGNVGSVALAPVTVTASQPSPQYTLTNFSFTGDGVTDIRPKGINDSGEVVGYYLDARADQLNSDDQITYEHGFYSTLSNGTRSYYTLDNPVSSTDAPAVQTRVMGINDKGEFVGWYAQQGYGIADDGEEYRLPAAGFIASNDWPGGVGSLGYQSSGDYGTHTLGINNDEDIVGYYYDGAGEEHGLLREFEGYGVRGDYVSLDPANSINTVAEGINDSGEVVGFYETSNGVYHGFRYNSSTGAYATLDVNGASDTYALGVNDSGTVVGYYVDSSGTAHGFVETASGQVTTVDDANAGSEGTEVTGIANDGEIVGWYYDSSGYTHGFTGDAVSDIPQDDATLPYKASYEAVWTPENGVLKIIDTADANAVVATVNDPGATLSGEFVTLSSDGASGTAIGVEPYAFVTVVPGDVVVSAITGQAYSAYEQLYNGGVYSGIDYFFTNVVGQSYSSYEYNYSAGGGYIGSNFFYTGIVGQAYTGEEIDYDGGGNVTRIAFTDDTVAPFSSYEYDYIGGVFAGSTFTYTSVPTGASYSSYEVDYGQNNTFVGDKFFFTGLSGQSGEEVDFDASGNLARVLLTGVTDQAYSWLELDYSAGSYTGYKAHYDFTGQSFTSEEVDVSAVDAIIKIVYSGLSGTPYSSVEQDYNGGALNDTIYDFTNVSGASAYAYQVTEDANGNPLQETFDNKDGSHTIIGLANGQTLTSIGNDTMTGGGSGATFVFNPVYGHDTITDFSSHETGAGHDTISLPTSEFANFSALMSAATYAGGNTLLTAPDHDTLTLLGVASLAGLTGDFSFHS